MKETFDKAMDFVFEVEGGYANLANDEVTIFGVKRSTWEHYVRHKVTLKEFRALTRDQVKVMYKDRYWDASRCDDYPVGIDAAVFDLAVHSGVSRALKLLQSTLGDVTVDGIPGPQTTAAVNRRDPELLLFDYIIEREEFLTHVKNYALYGKGWNNRIAKLKKFLTSLQPQLYQDNQNNANGEQNA